MTPPPEPSQTGTPFSSYGTLILRVTLAVVLLYFGISQFLQPSYWIGYLPSWSSAIPLSQTTLIYLNGSVEILGAILLLAGIWMLPVAILLALHLAAITLDLGWTEIGVRDLGLTGAMLSLAFFGSGKFSLDAWRQRRKT